MLHMAPFDLLSDGTLLRHITIEWFAVQHEGIN
jgi:hypothetical protein